MDPETARALADAGYMSAADYVKYCRSKETPVTDPIEALDAHMRKLLAKNEALCMAGSDLAVALQATRTGAKNAGIFGHQALEQWRKTLIAIEADRLEQLEKPYPINLRVVSTNKDHLKVVPQVSCASLDYRDVKRLHSDLETLEHEHRS